MKYDICYVFSIFNESLILPLSYNFRFFLVMSFKLGFIQFYYEFEPHVARIKKYAHSKKELISRNDFPFP